MLVLAVGNQKGGVGKTTTSLNVAGLLAEAGLKVLLIDLDPQGNSTVGAGITVEEGWSTIADVLLGRKSLINVIDYSPSLQAWVVPANPDLATAEMMMIQFKRREQVLAKAIAASQESHPHEFDLCILDCPPSLDLLTVNALVAADAVLTVLEPACFSRRGTEEFHSTIEEIQELFKPNLLPLGALVARSMGETVENRRTLAEMEHLNLFTTQIPYCAMTAKAQTVGQSVNFFAPWSPGAKAYLEFTKELIERWPSLARSVKRAESSV